VKDPERWFGEEAERPTEETLPSEAEGHGLAVIFVVARPGRLDKYFDWHLVMNHSKNLEQR
jgi:hypothetical protein